MRWNWLDMETEHYCTVVDIAAHFRMLLTATVGFCTLLKIII